MAFLHFCTLLALTLLQLCSAEIPNSLPGSWYSANVINDGYQPKPISEIFTTHPPFSSTNPIVVLSTSSPEPDEIVLLSTLEQSRNKNIFASSNGDTISSTVTTLSPPSMQTFADLPLNSTQQPEIEVQETPRPQVQTIPPQPLPALPPQPQPQPEIQVQSESPVLTESTPPPEFSTQPQIQTQPQSSMFLTQDQPQTTISTPQPNLQQQAIWPQSPIRIEMSPQAQIVERPSVPQNLQPQVVQAPSPGSVPSYILIYQQAPQYVQSDGGILPSSQEMPQVTTPLTTRASSTPSTVVITQPSTVSIQPRATVSSTSIRTATPSTTTARTTRGTVTSSRPINPAPCNNANLQTSSGLFPPFPLKIRVVAPSGSITNVRFNPITTTTRAPTTTRSRKPKRNTYDGCLDGCKANRRPICAVPLASTQIDQDTLKGFPSVCHMACHNSYRKIAYQQFIEGRCSLLRTRIKTADSNTKLKRDELNKAQYTVDNSRPQTIVEFSSALH